MSADQNSPMDDPALGMVLFSAGPWRVGIEARWVQGSCHAAPGTAAAEIEDLLGLPADGSHPGPRQLLALKQPDGNRAVLVGQPVDLTEIPVARLHRIPPLMAARIRLRGARALAFSDEGEAVLIFDPSLW